MSTNTGVLPGVSRARLLDWLKPVHFVAVAVMGLAIAHGSAGLGIMVNSRTAKQATIDAGIARRAARPSAGLTLDELLRDEDLARTRLKKAETLVSEEPRITPFLASVIELAKPYAVEVTAIASRKTSTRTVGQHGYLVSPVALTLDGEPVKLTAFVAALERLPGQTFAIKTLQLSTQDTATVVTAELEVYSRTSQLPVQPTRQETSGKGAR